MNFFTTSNLKILFISKYIPVKKFFVSTHGTFGTPQTVRWPCEPDIFSI